MRWFVPLSLITFSIVLSSYAQSQQPPQAGQKPASPSKSTENWQQEEGQYLKNIKQITHDFVRAGESYFSPDMKHIIFQAEEKGPNRFYTGPNPFYQMFVMELATGKHWRVSPGIGRTTCGYFHPDGKKVIFASAHEKENYQQEADAEFAKREQNLKSKTRPKYQWDFDTSMKIYQAYPDGSHMKTLTDAPDYNAEGSYSADGKQIVFCSKRDGHLNLYIMDADGNNVRQLTKTKDCYNGGPFFSPDGKRVIFRADRQEKDALQLFVINSDGTAERQLTDNQQSVNWCPYWHPNGTHIIYAGALHLPMTRPNYDLHVMNVETKATKRVTFAPGADVLPVFSPDGKKLMWTSNRDGRMPGTQVFMADFQMELP